MPIHLSKNKFRLNLFAATLSGLALSITPANISQASPQDDVQTHSDEPIMCSSLKATQMHGC
jgi:hypothetical protein